MSVFASKNPKHYVVCRRLLLDLMTNCVPVTQTGCEALALELLVQNILCTDANVQALQHCPQMATHPVVPHTAYHTATCFVIVCGGTCHYEC